MNPRAPLDPRLLEALSAYLDKRLEGAEKAALEQRLSREEDLRRQLSELRRVRDSLRALPAMKPPRALTLTPAQAGTPARRSGWFSPRGMALGSALAALAFLVVTSTDILSRGALASAPRPAAESFAAPAQLQAADQAAPTGGGGNPPTLLAQPTAVLLTPSTAGPSEKAGGGENATPTLTTPPPEPAPDRCGEPSFTNQVAERCGLSGEPTPQPFSLPDFQTLAPFLEVLLGLIAVLLAGLAIFFRSRTKK
ncbi:MAG: hypothetical protein WBM17_01325 [Anaerolineales bacterium]